MPKFLDDVITPDAYEKWLGRKAMAHVKRDSNRGHSMATVALYKEAIHAAVVLSEGLDAYTGEQLDWTLLSKYNNEESKAGRHGYKAGFALLPTVDHVNADATEASFRICSWRTNDAKNDLSLDAFVELCQKVLTHAGYTVKKREQSLSQANEKRKHFQERNLTGRDRPLEQKRREISDEDKVQIRSRIRQGDDDVHILAQEFQCSSAQIAGIKAWELNRQSWEQGKGAVRRS